MRNLAIKSTIASLLYILSSTAWAGTSTLFYGPPVTDIPTLSGTMLILLSLLLATIGYRILRQKGNNTSRMMVLSLIAVGALASGVGGVKLVNDADATSAVPLDQPGGGSVTVCDGCGDDSYENATGAPLEIKSRTKPDDCTWSASNSPECTPGLLLNDGAICYLRVESGSCNIG